MNIKETKEAINSWPDVDDDLKFPTIAFVAGDSHATVVELKALVRSHTRLAAAVERYLEPHANDSQSEMAYNELMAALDEARH